jgi:hypothetical protein
MKAALGDGDGTVLVYLLAPLRYQLGGAESRAMIEHNVVRNPVILANEVLWRCPTLPPAGRCY